MNTQHDALLIFSGLAGILIVATVIGQVLKWRVAGGQSHAVIDNLNARVNAWWVMVVAIGLAYLAGRNGVIVLFAIVSFFALREFATIAPTRRGDYMVLLLSFFVITPAQYALVAIQWYGFYSIFIPVYAFLLLPVLAILANDTRGFLERIAIVQWGAGIAGHGGFLDRIDSVVFSAPIFFHLVRYFWA